MNIRPHALPFVALLLVAEGALAEGQKPSLHIDPYAKQAPAQSLAPAPDALDESTPEGEAMPQSGASLGAPRRVVVYQTMEAAAKAGVNPATQPVQTEMPAERDVAPKWYLNPRYAVPILLALAVAGLILLRIGRRTGANAA